MKLSDKVKKVCEAVSGDDWEKKSLEAGSPKKKKLSPKAKKLVDRYKFLNSEQDRYTGSVFYKGQGDKREEAMLKEQQDIVAELKELGYTMDLYW